MKMQSDPRIPIGSDPALRARLYELWRELSLIVNTGMMWSTQGITAPTTGTWAESDTCKNTAPVEAGTAGSKYVVLGWIYTASGWLPMQVKTGN